jgi:hypothetical protein
MVNCASPAIPICGFKELKKLATSDYAALHGILPAFYMLHTSGGLVCDPT